MTTQVKYPDLYDDTSRDDSPQNKMYSRLYAAVLYLMRRYYQFDSNEENWLTVGSSAKPWAKTVTLKTTAEALGKGEKKPQADTPQIGIGEKIHVLAIYGRMLAENMGDPANGRAATDPPATGDQFINDPADPNGQLRIVSRFIEAFTAGERLYNANQELYERVYSRLQEVGTTTRILKPKPKPESGRPPPKSESGGYSPEHAEPTQVSKIFSRQMTEVVDRLVEDRLGPETPQLRLFIDEAIAQAAGGSIKGRASSIKIDLPNLDEDNSVEILPDNVRALAVLYFAAQLEDMRFFAVADKVAEQFSVGMLPVSRGPGGDNLFDYIKGATNRFTEMDRRGLYARAFGFAQGGVDEAMPNREFSNLWIRALSATSAYNRSSPSPLSIPVNRKGAESQLINLNVRSEGSRVHHMQVYKTLRDLAVNLSLHGFGIAHFAAVELQNTIRTIKAMLSHPDMLRAFGVRDYNQLIERVARMYLGSEINSIRQRVQAQSGARIIEWMATKSGVLASPTPPDAVIFQDRPLVDNVEKWLAVTGTAGATINQYSEPTVVSSQPTIPSMSLGGATQQLQDITEMVADGLPPLTN